MKSFEQTTLEKIELLQAELKEVKSLLHKTSGSNRIEMRVGEALNVLGITRTCFDKYRRQGIIKARKQGGKVFVDRECVERLVRERTFKD